VMMVEKEKRKGSEVLKNKGIYKWHRSVAR
jgi:hypothetical protein